MENARRDVPDRTDRKQGIAARFMPVNREALYLDGAPPKGWSESRNVSICERLLTTTTPDDLEAAICGLDRLRGYLDWLGPKDKATLRCLYDTRTGSPAGIQGLAQEAFWKARGKARPHQPPRAVWDVSKST